MKIISLHKDNLSNDAGEIRVIQVMVSQVSLLHELVPHELLPPGLSHPEYVTLKNWVFIVECHA
ncbi:hypothetical protein II582_03035 [bacterium]|nr:hypothetical protein [bacterium]